MRVFRCLINVLLWFVLWPPIALLTWSVLITEVWRGKGLLVELTPVIGIDSRREEAHEKRR